jgi:hypothetical protein
MILLSVWSCLPPAAANRGCWSHQTGFAATGGKQDMRAEETFGKSLLLAGQSTLHRRGVGGGGFTATSVVSMTSSQKSNSKWPCPTKSVHRLNAYPFGSSNNCCRRAANSGGNRLHHDLSISPTSIMSRMCIRSLSRNDVNFILASASKVNVR